MVVVEDTVVVEDMVAFEDTVAFAGRKRGWERFGKDGEKKRYRCSMDSFFTPHLNKFLRKVFYLARYLSQRKGARFKGTGP